MGSLQVFRKAPHGNTFGVEIECIPGGGTPGAYRNTDSYVGFFWCTTDMSLTSYGREYVSQPMPYDMLVRHIKWLHNKVNWTTDRRCGLHIHISRTMWSDKREAAFSEFLRSFTPETMERYFGRSTSFADPYEDRDAKFRAINVLHKHTYEFRVWKAGDLAWTLECLRRTREIVRFQGAWTPKAMDKICGLTAVKPVKQATTTINPCAEIIHSHIHMTVSTSQAERLAHIRYYRDHFGCSLVRAAELSRISRPELWTTA